MVGFTLPHNSSVHLRSSLLPQTNQYLNRVPFLTANAVNVRGMQSKETRVFPRIHDAVSLNESSNSRGDLADNLNPVIVIDNYDSFTYNLCQYMGELGCNFEVYRNDDLTVDELKKKNPRGIVISPGPGAPQDSGISLQTVLELGPYVPLFGACMGLQCIGEAFGGKIVRSPYGVMHGKSSLVHYDEGEFPCLFAGISNPFTAGRYDSLVIEKESFLSDALEITAWTKDGVNYGCSSQTVSPFAGRAVPSREYYNHRRKNNCCKLHQTDRKHGNCFANESNKHFKNPLKF